ncbi:stimulator of interferon genes -like [Paramuricea clavata]|uniref:Stimulator of interferon genes -like n=1 Tax=Paramuricea clavata TaxID=317549 RepID=A0A7D9M8U2_PARCT|nr:stimulator of interferon genes -like [Paramuricea clavata]
MFGSYTEDPFQTGTKMEESAIIFDEYDLPSAAMDLDKNHGFGPIPEKRQKRAAFVSVGLSLIIMVVLIGAFTKPKDELYVVEGNTSMLHEDEMFCRKDDQYYHVGIFIWSLNLIGIILGEFVNRSCLMFEEYFHLYTRYGGSKRKMFYACFSDISFRAVFFATLVAFVIIGSTLLSQGTKYFKFEYIEIILSGVGSSTLVLYLLSLDTLSRVQVSSLMENNNRLVANGLAWSYYFGYLKIILPKLHERIAESEWKDVLSSNKLFILMPRDCWAYGKLSEEAEDGKIELAEGGVVEVEAERAGISKRSYRNNVYKIKIDDCEPLQVLAEYATPLCSMYDMNHSAEANLSVEDRDEQAKLFVRTLEAILRNPSVPEVRNKCKLVPYARSPDSDVPVSKVLADAVLDDMKENSSLDSLDGIVEENTF